MSDLKPCPFCGGEAQLTKAHAYHVVCGPCGIRGKGNRKKSREFAVDWWNTRHSDPDMVLVPREPTEGMIEAFAKSNHEVSPFFFERGYKAMIQAWEKENE